jgi:hypothetical protein
MPRWLLALLAVSLAVLAVIAARPILLPPPNPGITMENYERLKFIRCRGDVHLEDFEAILGPPGDYRTQPTPDHSHAIVSSLMLRPEEADAVWKGDEATIWVKIGPGGEVSLWAMSGENPEPVGLFDRLRWRCDHWRKSRR